jgi:tetratricopeptide (TPR) repeat protein
MVTKDHTPGRRNEVLEILLCRVGWSPEQLATRLNALAKSLRISGHVDQLTPRRWVYDSQVRRPRKPNPPWPTLVPVLFSQQLGEQITPTMLGWPDTDPLMLVSANHGLSDLWTPQTALAGLAQIVEPNPMERRQFIALTGAPLTAVALRWLLDPGRVAASLRGDRVTDALLNDFGQVTNGLRRMDDKMGGGKLLPTVREQLRLVVELLKNGSYTEAVGKRLHAQAAELGRLAGWVIYDGGDEALAQRYLMAALRNAHVSGDHAIGANILAFMSIPAAHSSNPRDAVDLVRSALRYERELTPAVAGMLHVRLAKGAAAVGDAYTAKRSLDSAAELLRRSSPDEEPDWIYWFDQAQFNAIAGQTALRLKRFTEAETHLRGAVALFGSDFSRDRTLYLCDLAKARLGTGAVEHACATASDAAVAIRRLNSKRDQNRLAEFRQALTPYASTKAAREFDDKHGDLIAAVTM